MAFLARTDPTRNINPFAAWLDILTAVFAVVAAGFWFASAAEALPPMLSYWGGVPVNDPFYSAIRFSAKMNAFAAVFSGVSAVCMGISAILRWFQNRAHLTSTEPAAMTGAAKENSEHGLSDPRRCGPEY
jgi:hypothetical protein